MSFCAVEGENLACPCPLMEIYGMLDVVKRKKYA